MRRFVTYCPKGHALYLDLEYQEAACPVCGLILRDRTKEWRRVRELKRYVRRMSILCGALGAFMGVALFICASEEKLEFPLFVGQLILAALAASVIEWLRQAAEPNKHKVGPEKQGATPRIHWTLRVARWLSNFVMVIVCELFVIAFYHLSKVKWGPFLEEVFGDDQLAHKGYLTGFALLLCVASSVFALSISRTVLSNDRNGVANGLKYGAIAGFVHVPVVLAVAGLLLNMTWAARMYWTNGVWPNSHVMPYGRLIFGLILAYVFILPALTTWTSRGSWFGGVVAFVFVTWIAYLRYGVDVNLSELFREVWEPLKYALLAGLVWGIPGLVLGGLAPLLRRPAAIPWLWTILSFLVAVVSGVLVWFHVLFLLPAIVSIVSIPLSIRQHPFDQRWPLFAICVAILPIGILSLVPQATTLGLYANLKLVMDAPARPVRPLEPWWRSGLVGISPGHIEDAQRLQEEIEREHAVLDKIENEPSREMRLHLLRDLIMTNRQEVDNWQKSDILTRFEFSDGIEMLNELLLYLHHLERFDSTLEKWQADGTLVRFDTSFVASLSFWITLGLLAGWKRRLVSEADPERLSLWSPPQNASGQVS